MTTKRTLLKLEIIEETGESETFGTFPMAPEYRMIYADEDFDKVLAHLTRLYAAMATWPTPPGCQIGYVTRVKPAPDLDDENLGYHGPKARDRD